MYYVNTSPVVRSSSMITWLILNLIHIVGLHLNCKNLHLSLAFCMRAAMYITHTHFILKCIKLLWKRTIFSFKNGEGAYLLGMNNAVNESINVRNMYIVYHFKFEVFSCQHVDKSVHRMIHNHMMHHMAEWICLGFGWKIASSACCYEFYD